MIKPSPFQQVFDPSRSLVRAHEAVGETAEHISVSLRQLAASSKSIDDLPSDEKRTWDALERSRERLQRIARRARMSGDFAKAKRFLRTANERDMADLGAIDDRAINAG